MNIFVLDFDTVLCAQYHCDKHVLKMNIEYAQLLSSAFQYWDLDYGYKLTHQNHPCSLWVRESKQNYLWLKELAIELNKEWQYRYNHERNHKSFDIILSLPSPEHLQDKGITNFSQCMPDEFKSNNVVESYRNFYIRDKSRFATWKRRETPIWYIKN